MPGETVREKTRTPVVGGNRISFYTFPKSPLLPKPRDVTYRQCKPLRILTGVRFCLKD
jgi:hypothetical protein